MGTAGEVDANFQTVQEQPGLRRAKAGTQGAAIKGEAFRWSGGKLIFEIDPALPNLARIEQAIAH